MLYDILCKDQFKKLFGASRVPNRSKDTIAVYENTNHVAVMCCNQLFYFQALWPDGDVAVDEGDLVDILEAIRVHAHKLEKSKQQQQKTSSSSSSSTPRGIADSTRRGSFSGGNNNNNIDNVGDLNDDKNYEDSVSALGVLTSLGRNQWAKAREEMIKFSPTKNAESFKIVDSALFVLVLDDCIPKNIHEAAANMLHGSYELSERRVGSSKTTEYQSGSCTNRWYDKLQVSRIHNR